MQGQYRLGSSLLAREKYQEAIKPFSKSLQLLLRDASSSESDKVDTLTQLLSTASNLSGTTETNQRLLVFSSVPQFVLCSKGDISFLTNFFYDPFSANLRVQKLGKFCKYHHNKEKFRHFLHQAYSLPGYLNAWPSTWDHWLTDGRKEWMNDCTNARMQECKNAQMRECMNVRMHESMNPGMQSRTRQKYRNE